MESMELIEYKKRVVETIEKIINSEYKKKELSDKEMCRLIMFKYQVIYAVNISSVELILIDSVDIID